MYKQRERQKSITKQEIITALHACAKKLGRVPSYAELSKMSRVKFTAIRRHFGTFTQALRATEMEVGHCGVTSSMKDLFDDWAGVARRVKRIPTINDHSMHGKYSPRPFLTRFGG